MATRTLIVGDDGSNRIQGSSGADLLYGFDPDGPQGTVSSIAATRVAAGLNGPLFATAAPGDASQLFIVEKTGRIKVLDLDTGEVLATPFLNVSAEISSAGESGLLGLAFDPDYETNGFLYVYLINTDGDTEIRRYQVSSNPNRVDPASEVLIARIDQPDAPNHKAGWISFGPDGHLYIATGDGGRGASANAQNTDVLLGKILRIDVRNDDFPADPDRNYAIPADNPFVGAPGVDEIWAYGLRNPFRPSFDRGLGDLYIPDVGQGRWEEINLGQIGANYGWDLYEGPDPYPPGSDPTDPSGLTFPIHAYDHSVGEAITGGYVYRGPEDGLHGDYFFADFITGRFWTLENDGANWVETERTGQIAPDIGTIDLPSSFGEDALGRLYVVDFDGEVYRLTPQTAATDGGDVLRAGAGDDMVFGGGGNDRLFGESGLDVLVGGGGDDAYFVTDAGDEVIEAPGHGARDVVIAAVDYDLIDGIEVEVLAAAGGVAGGLRLAGNDFANRIVGSAEGDVLIGAAGDDVLSGLGGDDRLVGGGGADRLLGGEGADRLYGGFGGDAMFGGLGSDIFEFASAIDGERNVDRLGDFEAGDMIELSRAVFTTLASGPLDPAAFHVGESAGDPGHRIVFRSNGLLLYDPDGDGSAAATPFALVLPGAGLTSDAFTVV